MFLPTSAFFPILLLSVLQTEELLLLYLPSHYFCYYLKSTIEHIQPFSFSITFVHFQVQLALYFSTLECSPFSIYYSCAFPYLLSHYKHSFLKFFQHGIIQSFSIFVIIALTSLSAQSNIWLTQGRFLVPFFLINGHLFYISHSICIFQWSVNDLDRYCVQKVQALCVCWGAHLNFSQFSNLLWL